MQTLSIPVSDPTASELISDQDLQVMLVSRRQSERVRALKELLRSPNCSIFKQEVYLIASSTCHYETWQAAMKALWVLDLHRYVEIQKNRPFGR